MLPQQFTAQIISHARADKGTENLDEPPSQKEGKRAAGQGRSQAQLRRSVLVPDPVDLIQMGVKLIRGHRARLLVKLLHKPFQPVQLAGIDPGIIKAQGMGKRPVSVKTTVVDGHQSDIGRTGKAQLLRHRVHGASHPPGSSPAAQQH